MDFVIIKKVVIEDELYYNNELLLYYKIEYPQLFSENYQSNCVRINRYLSERAFQLVKYCVDIHFQLAINHYRYSIKRNIPIRQFEMYYVYTITNNENNILSLYYDDYRYLGGAHGMTERTSDTFNIETGDIIKLCSLFNYNVDYVRLIKDFIKMEIRLQSLLDNNMYFEDYEKNVDTYFNVNSFYLTPQGIVIYFQQYEIAPYAAGIPEFLIPYEQEEVVNPSC